MEEWADRATSSYATANVRPIGDRFGSEYSLAWQGNARRSGEKDLYVINSFERLAKVLPWGKQLQLQHALISGDWAVVELRSLASAQNSLGFDNRYGWICRFSAGKIVEVRAYLDPALVARWFEQNPV